jgi:drug/metabolite transporter (DMT)-like permease
MVASLVFDGPALMLQSLVSIDLTTILSLVYLAFVATIVGYGIWGSLLGRYETWRVAPLSLLVPVVGMASAALLLGESLSVAAGRGGADYGGAVYQCVWFSLTSGSSGVRDKKAPPKAGQNDQVRSL